MKIAQQLGELPPRAQRVIAVLLIPTALVSIFVAVIWPIWHLYQSQVQWRDNAERLLAQRRGLSEIETVVRERLDALPQLKIWQRLFRTTAGTTAVIALQTEVNTALSSARARPQSFEPLETTQVGPLQKIGVRIVAPMTIDQLKDVLARVEGLTHLVRIEQLLINAPPTQSPDQNPTLIVTLDAVGYAIDAAAIEPVSAATVARQ